MEDVLKVVIGLAKDLNGFVVTLMVAWLIYTGKLALGREVQSVKDDNSVIKRDRDFWRSVSFSALKLTAHITNLPADTIPVPPSEKED